MRTDTRRSRLLAAAVLAASLVVVAPALTGCDAIRGAIEDATGGEVELGGKELPADFPSAVPLIDGEVVASASVGGKDGKGWNVTISVADGSAFDEISAQLTDAGFAASELGGSTEQGSTGTFTKKPYTVLVVVTGGDSPAGWVANYTVTESGH